MRKRALIGTALVAVISLLFLFSPALKARKNPYSGILPPQRLKTAIETQKELLTEEPISPDLRLVINIPARKISLIDEGREVARYDVAVGQPVYKTPAGPQEITKMIWNPWWIPPDSPWARGSSPDPPGPRNTLGPLKLMMGQGIRLHGTNKDSSVGNPASHGCLRMHNEEVTKLGWYIQKRINNSDDSLFDKYQRNRRVSYYVNLDFPVKVDIVYEPVEIRDNIVYIYPDIYGWAKDVKTEVLDAMMKSGINLTKINAERLSELKYPKNRNGVLEINISELMDFRPRQKVEMTRVAND